jgi:Sec-independent protein translocase protein TatA
MLSVTEIAILGVGALLLFGPDRLPGIMRKAGRVMRDVQNTSQSFIREMERAADEHEGVDSSRPQTDDPPADRRPAP